MELGGGSGGGVGVLLESRFECGGALARLAGCGLRRVAFSLEFLSPVAVLRGFSGSDVDQRLEIRRSAGGLFALLVESLLQDLDFALAVHSGCVCAGGLLAGFVEIGVGVIERRLELLGAGAVLGGFSG